MRRIFAAIDISNEARQRVADHIDQLRKNVDSRDLRWEPVEKLHLTIRFIGDVDEYQLTNIAKGINQAAASLAAFDLSLDSTGVFPSAHNARILWLGVEDRTGSVAKIKDLFDAGLDRIGAAADRRPLKLHLTIARIKRPGPLANKLIRKHLDSNFEPVSFNVREIVLYESTLLPTGSVYSIVSRNPLSLII